MTEAYSAQRQRLSSVKQVAPAGNKPSNKKLGVKSLTFVCKYCKLTAEKANGLLS